MSLPAYPPTKLLGLLRRVNYYIIRGIDPQEFPKLLAHMREWGPVWSSLHEALLRAIRYSTDPTAYAGVIKGLLRTSEVPPRYPPHELLEALAKATKLNVRIMRYIHLLRNAPSTPKPTDSPKRPSISGGLGDGALPLTAPTFFIDITGSPKNRISARAEEEENRKYKHTFSGVSIDLREITPEQVGTVLDFLWEKRSIDAKVTDYEAFARLPNKADLLIQAMEWSPPTRDTFLIMLNERWFEFCEDRLRVPTSVPIQANYKNDLYEPSKWFMGIVDMNTSTGINATSKTLKFLDPPDEIYVGNIGQSFFDNDKEALPIPSASKGLSHFRRFWAATVQAALTYLRDPSDAAYGRLRHFAVRYPQLLDGGFVVLILNTKHPIVKLHSWTWYTVKPPV